MCSQSELKAIIKVVGGLVIIFKTNAFNDSGEVEKLRKFTESRKMTGGNNLRSRTDEEGERVGIKHVVSWYLSIAP